jgi:diguanylate cyclase (GGDEF)-like protein
VAYPESDPLATKVAKLQRAPARASKSATPDLSARLRVSQRAIRSLLESRATLIDVLRAVNTTLEPVRIAEAIVEQASTWLPVPSWAIVCPDLSGQLSVFAERGLPPELASGAHSIAGWVMTHGEEFSAANLGRDARISAPSPATVLAFPLTCRGRTIGVLVGLDRGPSTRRPEFAPAALRAFRVLLEPAAAALDNAARLRRTAALSVTDDLTGLYNSRFLNQVLRRETKRASRSGRPLSLLFLDLDDFKTVNDRHGHLCGSRTLVEAADVIRSSARETDIVARFGGDEFSLVLPDTGAQGAFAVGERIRSRVAMHAFLASEGLSIRLTVSVGVATLPDAASGAEELVQAADAAMYRIKDRGKNGIEAAPASADR